jgi:choline dehydrogenase
LVAAYDFIVVGAGSAGCAVAGRLADDPSSRVLLIEAGGTDRRFTIRAPLAFSLQFGSSLDWAYESEPEPGCAGRRIALPRGRALGGTSSMNAMIWVKGSNLDYDGWRIPGWAWTDVAPIFARMERRMRVAPLEDPDELSSLFVTSARAAGIPANDDVSGPVLDGAAISRVTIHRGQRWSSARGYLDRQKNLTVVTRAQVRRVVLRKGRAVAVEYRHRGRVETAVADHEVVVSAGAYGTPALLQLSGIGAADHLNGVGITPLIDSPRVGMGLTDHPHVFATWSLAPGRAGMTDAVNPKHVARWLLTRRGKWASNLLEALAHIRSAPELLACDIQLTFAPDDLGTKTLRPKPTMTVASSYWTPESRGSVLIRSSNPDAPPAIRTNMLTERGDVDALVKAVQRSREIVATGPLASVVEQELVPGLGTDLEAVIRETAITASHPGCTVAMGTDPHSPLDEKLRVRGVQGLRVADASALPVLPRANTNAPSIMIGERCADLVLSDAR